ncbi:MAG: hypothetical protein R6U20_11445 [Longimonas sp.]|uniref:hypothetical protein n=1 Tax=Longimonas sp. TaxID=2039626 RepID=UPI003976CE8F
MSTAARTHRERIQQKPLLGATAEATAPTGPTKANQALSTLRSILAEHNTGAAFQSVVIAAVHIVERAVCHEQCVADAALSLGQQEKLSEMVDRVEEAALLLRQQLNTQSGSLTHLCGDRPARSSDAEPWPEALFSAVQVLEECVSQLVSLSNAQPKGSASRTLSDAIAKLLRSHHNTLLLEAEEWMA